MKKSLSTVENTIMLIEKISDISLIHIVIKEYKDKDIHSVMEYNRFFDVIPSIILNAPIDKYELISDGKVTKLLLYVKCRHLMNTNFDIAENLPTRAYLIDELMHKPKNGILITDNILDIMMQSATMLSILYNRFHQSASLNFFCLYLNHIFGVRPRNSEFLYTMWVKTGLINASVSTDDIINTNARVLCAKHSIDNINHDNYIISVVHYIMDNLDSGSMIEESLDILNSIVKGLLESSKNNIELIRMVSCLLVRFSNDSNDVNIIRKGLMTTNNLAIINDLIDDIDESYSE